MKRLLVIAAASLLPLLAAAQPSGGGSSGAATQSAAGADRMFEAHHQADFQNWLWRAQRGVEPSPGQVAVRAVLDAMQRKDCQAAVAALNAGLAKGHSEVLMLAAGMFEEGACLRPNWDRAVALYQRALSAGHPSAAARLAAGYAAPAGGTDKAAALWWATRAGTALPADCRMSAANADDPDRFVAALKGWNAAQLDACVYAAAVMASVQAELQTPGLAAGYGLAGALDLDWTPAAGPIRFSEDLNDDVAPAGRLADAADEQSARRAERKAFGAALQGVAERALARYPKPAALPAGWRVQTRFAFKASR